MGAGLRRSPPRRQHRAQHHADKSIRFGVTATARTGTAYNITTGQDDNLDTVFNDRPARVGRNSATTKGMWDASARVSYAFGFGSAPRRRAGRAARPS